MSPSHVPHVAPSQVVVPSEHWKKSPERAITLPHGAVSPAVEHAQPGLGFAHSLFVTVVVVVPPPFVVVALAVAGVLEQAGMACAATPTTIADRAAGMSRFATPAAPAVFITQSSERQFMRGTSEGKGDAAAGDLRSPLVREAWSRPAGTTRETCAEFADHAASEQVGGARGLPRAVQRLRRYELRAELRGCASRPDLVGASASGCVWPRRPVVCRVYPGRVK